MIEKLKAYEETPSGYKHPENRVQDKINELVDAVNSLRDDCNVLMGYIAPENKCEPVENTQMLETTEKLERTRKALDVAVDALKEIRDAKFYDSMATYECLTYTAHEALEQITALEQKD